MNVEANLFPFASMDSEGIHTTFGGPQAKGGRRGASSSAPNPSTGVAPAITSMGDGRMDVIVEEGGGTIGDAEVRDDVIEDLTVVGDRDGVHLFRIRMCRSSPHLLTLSLWRLTELPRPGDQDAGAPAMTWGGGPESRMIRTRRSTLRTPTYIAGVRTRTWLSHFGT